MLVALILLLIGIILIVLNPILGLIPGLLIVLAIVLAILALLGRGIGAIASIGSTKTCPECRSKIPSDASDHLLNHRPGALVNRIKSLEKSKKEPVIEVHVGAAEPDGKVPVQLVTRSMLNR